MSCKRCVSKCPLFWSLVILETWAPFLSQHRFVSWMIVRRSNTFTVFSFNFPSEKIPSYKYLAGLTMVSSSVARWRRTYDLDGGIPRALASASALKVGSRTRTAPWTPDSLRCSAYSYSHARLRLVLDQLRPDLTLEFFFWKKATTPEGELYLQIYVTDPFDQTISGPYNGIGVWFLTIASSFT